MKTCPNCNATLSDNAAFCTTCGNSVQQGQPQNQQQVYYTSAVPTYDPYDHTAEFASKDISENKVYCMLVYLMGWVGIVIALLAAPQSPYTAFHVRQALKINVTTTLMFIVTALLCWTIIVPIAAGIMSIVFSVIQIICFFQICAGKAKEPAIIRSLSFLK